MSTLSILFNVGVFVYARNAIVQLLAVADELGDLKEMADSLAEHMKQVYELEMFYGDDTLQHLMEHARSFNEYLTTFDYIYTLTEEDAPTNMELLEETEYETETKD